METFCDAGIRPAHLASEAESKAGRISYRSAYPLKFPRNRKANELHGGPKWQGKPGKGAGDHSPKRANVVIPFTTAIDGDMGRVMCGNVGDPIGLNDFILQ